MNNRLQILSFFLILILNTYVSIGQDLYWHQNQPPLYSDFKYLNDYQGDSIIIAGKELIIGADSHWQLFQPQPPCQIHKISSNLCLQHNTLPKFGFVSLERQTMATPLSSDG